MMLLTATFSICAKVKPTCVCRRVAIALVKASTVHWSISCFSCWIQMKFAAYFLILRFIIAITCCESKAFETNNNFG